MNLKLECRECGRSPGIPLAETPDDIVNEAREGGWTYVPEVPPTWRSLGLDDFATLEAVCPVCTEALAEARKEGNGQRE
jgi:hypothetical protein